MTQKAKEETVPGQVLYPDPAEIQAEFQRLLDIMDTLRSPGGCPWDGEQTHQSLMRYLIEEAYEVVEAVEAPSGLDRALLQEELGDVLLQVVFHARVAAETPRSEGGFTLLEVLRGLNKKLERRHPHVFSDQQVPGGAEGVKARWDDLKKQEKPERTGPFDGIPPQLPALALAEKTLAKATRAGLAPGQGSLLSPGLSVDLKNEEDLGAFLFGVVACAHTNGLDAERALRSYTRSYIQRHSGDSI